MTKNIGKSIRMRLLNLAKEEKQEYMKVLVRYLHERLLFRISSSPYKRHFLLKGSSLLFALDRFKARPTIDIDLLGERISNDKDNLKVVFEKICSIECEDDGVFFDASSLELEPIAIDKKYPGTCVKIEAHLDTIVQQVSVDIGFGDVVTPYPLPLDYPLLLSDVPAVELYAYSLETLIAEKFHAMVDRDESNSRMKDFLMCISCSPTTRSTEHYLLKLLFALSRIEIRHTGNTWLFFLMRLLQIKYVILGGVRS